MFKKSSGTLIREHSGHKGLSENSPIVEFLKPNFVYFPLMENNCPYESLVNVGDKVKVGQLISIKSGRFPSFTHSSVSGEVISIDKKMWHPSGKMVPTIEIKNDLQETMFEEIKDNDVSNLTSKDIINIVKNCGVVGLGGACFPTYVKYNPDNNINTIIINAAECEPYITADYVTMINNVNELIRGISYIMKANNASRGVIAVKKYHTELVEHLQKSLANINNISLFLLDNVYPAGWEKYIVQRVQKKTYKGLPAEVGAVVNNVQTAVSVCQAVEKNMPLIEKIITFTGKGLKEPKNVRVKIGSLVNEIIDFIGGYIDDLEDAYLIAGGPMTGNTIVFDNMIAAKMLGSVIVMPKEKQEVELPCMGCGKCTEICPVFLSPILIKNAYDDKDVEKIIKLDANRCMACGLCSYVCPSRIELTDIVTRAKTLANKK